MRFFILMSILFCFSSHLTASQLSSDQAIQKLMEGNRRYVADQLEHRDQSTARREEIFFKQTPFAVVIGCSDSRVPPEIVFDQGLGDLFVVRVAGNVVGDIELESIQYAVSNLHVPVILVLGHQNCAAVKAVLENKIKHLAMIAKLIKPAIVEAKKCQEPLLNCVVKENVKLVSEKLKRKKQIAKLTQEGSLKVIGGYYDLDTGQVKLNF